MKVNIGINWGGRVQHVLTLNAETLDAAKDDWAKIMGFNDCLWDKTNKSYFGFPLVETDLPSMPRKSNPNPFQY